jgi:hypothetical protein
MVYTPRIEKEKKRKAVLKENNKKSLTHTQPSKNFQALTENDTTGLDDKKKKNQIIQLAFSQEKLAALGVGGEEKVTKKNIIFIIAPLFNQRKCYLSSFFVTLSTILGGKRLVQHYHKPEYDSIYVTS